MILLYSEGGKGGETSQNYVKIYLKPLEKLVIRGGLLNLLTTLVVSVKINLILKTL